MSGDRNYTNTKLHIPDHEVQECESINNRKQTSDINYWLKKKFTKIKVIGGQRVKMERGLYRVKEERFERVKDHQPVVVVVVSVCMCVIFHRQHSTHSITFRGLIPISSLQSGIRAQTIISSPA